MKYAHIRGILFDKDGTLLDNNLLWAPVGKAIGKMIADSYYSDSVMAQRVMTAIGFDRQGKGLLANSPLASGTASDVTAAIRNEFKKCGENIDFNRLLKKVTETIENAIRENAGLIRPIGNVKGFFDYLKGRNIYIGLATADFYSTAIICLQQLEIDSYFSYIGADDGKTKPKPDPELLLHFCETCNLKSSEVAVVGDSKIDIEMGKNGAAGMTVAICDKSTSAAYGADITVDSVEKIKDYL